VSDPTAPPHDLEAERAVLASVFLDPAALALVEPLVRVEDFYGPANALTFDAMLAVARRGEPVDSLTVAAELRTRERLTTVGGHAYLDALTDTIPTTAHVEAHAAIVAECSEMRSLAAAGMELWQLARSPGATAQTMRERALAVLGGVAGKVRGKGPQSFRDLAERYYEQLLARYERGEGIDGLTTGLRELDQLLSGLHGGELVVVGARPRVGKTALVMQMAVAAARASGKPVLGFSLEMAALALFGRTACSSAGVEGTSIRQGLISQDDMRALLGAINDLSTVSVYLDDASATTVADIRARAVAMKARHGLAMVFCDYLQLVEATSSKAGTREREVAQMSRTLKVLARELDVPVVVLSQLNRDVDKRSDNRPVLADLRESGALEQDADVVAFLYRDALYHPDTEDRDVAEIIVAKQRNGPPDTVRVRWDGPFTRFADLERADDNRAPAEEYYDAAE
jgi:replicative DNA helicase